MVQRSRQVVKGEHERIRGDATISEPVRRRALELAETFWARHMATEVARERKE